MSTSTIDTSIDPVPTGAAAHLAAAHSQPHPLRLHGAWFCPFVQRTWIVLAEKRIPHQYVETNPYRKDPALLRLNPRGLVPTLEIAPAAARPRALYESTVICEYLDERFADESRFGPRLLPPVSDDDDDDDDGGGGESAYLRARCRLWIHHVATRIVPAFYRLLQHTGEKGYTIEEARGELLGALKAFAGAMVEADRERDRERERSRENGDGDGDGDGDGPWFLGDRFSLVDVALAPWAKRLFLIDHYKPGGVGIPAKGQRAPGEEEVWVRWDRWFEAVAERESVRATWSDDEMYVQVYRRYAEDTTQSEVGKATRQGRGLP